MAKKLAVKWLKENSREHAAGNTHERIIADKRKQAEIDRAEDQMHDAEFDERHAHDVS